jgi:hypothetical protein
MSVKSFLSGIPLIGGLFDDSQEKAQEALAKNGELWGQLETPDFAKYTPEEYKLAGLYDPTKAEATTVGEDPALRSQQLSALNKLAGLADTGLSDVDQAGYEKARQNAGQIQHSGLQAALQNANARGIGGSGMELGLREMANQQGAQSALDAGLTQASDSAKMRAMYQQAFGNAIGGLRQQDFGNQAANADIMNRFNAMNTQNMNQAQQYNLGNVQGLSNANVGNANQAQQYNNQMTQQAYADRAQKVAGQAGANTQVAGGYAAENAANNAARNSNTGLLANLLLPGAGAATPAAGATGPSLANAGTDATNYWDKNPYA